MKKIKDVQQFFDKDSAVYVMERYAGKSCEHFSYQARKQIVLNCLKEAEGSIIDIGCGPGIFSVDLYNMGLSICSVDLSFEMLKKAREKMKAGYKGSWVNCEIEKLPFKNETFDNIIVIGVIAYANETHQVILEIARLLKPGGLLVI